MAISMYEASVPVFVRMLNSLVAILGKAAAHAQAKKCDPDVFAGCRLIADMHPLSRQIQILSDTAKGAAARLTGMEPPQWRDEETTLPELLERLKKTSDYLQTFEPAQFEGCENRKIVLKLGPNTVEFEGKSYLLTFVLPNFFFHATTAYDILRANGVEIGKRDYMGA